MIFCDCPHTEMSQRQDHAVEKPGSMVVIVVRQPCLSLYQKKDNGRRSMLIIVNGLFYSVVSRRLFGL